MRTQVVRTGFKRTDKLKTLKHQEKLQWSVYTLRTRSLNFLGNRKDFKGFGSSVTLPFSEQKYKKTVTFYGFQENCIEKACETRLFVQALSAQTS